MINAVNDIEDLMVVMRRPDGGGPIKGLVLPRGSLRASLLLKPGDLTGALAPLATLAGRLPDVQLNPAQQATRRKLCGPRLGAVLRNYAYCIRAVPGVLPKTDMTKWPSPDRLEQLADLMDRYAGIRRYGQQGVTRAMDLRLLVGAFQWFLLKQVVTVVNRRMQDPETPAAERSKLQNAFSGLLLRKEQLLSDNQATRDQRAQANQQTQQQTADAQKMQVLLDTIQALRMNLPVDQATLEEAAAYYAEVQQRQGGAAGPQGATGGGTTATDTGGTQAAGTGTATHHGGHTATGGTPGTGTTGHHGEGAAGATGGTPEGRGRRGGGATGATGGETAAGSGTVDVPRDPAPPSGNQRKTSR